MRLGKNIEGRHGEFFFLERGGGLLKFLPM